MESLAPICRTLKKASGFIERDSALKCEIKTNEMHRDGLDGASLRVAWVLDSVRIDGKSMGRCVAHVAVLANPAVLLDIINNAERPDSASS